MDLFHLPCFLLPPSRWTSQLTSQSPALAPSPPPSCHPSQCQWDPRAQDLRQEEEEEDEEKNKKRKKKERSKREIGTSALSLRCEKLILSGEEARGESGSGDGNHHGGHKLREEEANDKR